MKDNLIIIDSNIYVINKTENDYFITYYLVEDIRLPCIYMPELLCQANQNTRLKIIENNKLTYIIYGETIHKNTDEIKQQFLFSAQSRNTPPQIITLQPEGLDFVSYQIKYVFTT